jgi:DDE_Tnp_1-associated
LSAQSSGHAVPGARVICRLADDLADRWLGACGPARANGRDLLELLGRVSDGRTGQGRDHPVAAVLALAAAAVVAGSRSFTAIAGWPADVSARRRKPRSGAWSSALIPPL